MRTVKACSHLEGAKLCCVSRLSVHSNQSVEHMSVMRVTTRGKTREEAVCPGSCADQIKLKRERRAGHLSDGADKARPSLLGAGARSQAEPDGHARVRLAARLFRFLNDRANYASYRAPDVVGTGLPGSARGPLGRRIGTGWAGGAWCMVTISASAGFFPAQT
jgi:hypothetical protein